MVNNYIPKRGDIVFTNFTPQSGKEQSGKRPALVISKEIYNKKVGLALMIPISTQIKGYPFEVLIPKNLKTKGVILSDHIKNLDWQIRKTTFIEKLPKKNFQEVLYKLNALIN